MSADLPNFSLCTMFLGLVLFCGVSLNRFSRILKMPILLCFLGVGIACGKYGINLFPEIRITNVQYFGTIALCFIMFSGGLQTSFRSIRSVFVTGTILSTLGVILTTFFLAVLIHPIANDCPILSNPTFPQCLLLAAVISSTDAAAVFSILRGRKTAIPPRLQSLLEYESGSNDPAAFLLTSIMIEIVRSGAEIDFVDISCTIVIKGIVLGLAVGAAIGFLVGIFAQWFYNWIQSFLEYSGLRLVTAVAVVLFCYGLTDSLFQSNVLMASYVAGITMGNIRFNYKQFFIRTHDGISWLMQILLFTMLGCFFDYRMLGNLRNMLGAVILSLLLMFLIRPLVVMLCMTGSPFCWKERLFTGWVGIRGSAPIMLAAVVLAEIPKAQGEIQMENLFYLVFTVVLFSILLQGSTIMWAAKKLGLVRPYVEGKESLLNYEERADGSELQLFSIARENPLVGKSLQESGLAKGAAVLLMLRRGNEVLQQDPDLVLQSGDLLTFLGKREELVDLHARFFSADECCFPPTFRQLWDKFFSKYRNRSGKRFWKYRRRLAANASLRKRYQENH